MKTILSLLFLIVLLTSTAAAWGNGYSVYGSDIYADEFSKWERVDMYGTHDYLAQRALDMLKQEAPEEAAWILNSTYFYGTELPDSDGHKESLNDRVGQVLGFDSDGRLTDSRLADLSVLHYDVMVSSIQKGAKGIASKWAGVAASYISDAWLFSRVIPYSRHGDGFERYVLRYTTAAYPSKTFDNLYGDYIEFDGKLEKIYVYDAVVRLGRDTYMGRHGDCSASWMEQNYDLDNMSEFTECAGKNFNNIVNAIVDVLHTAYYEAEVGGTYDKAAYDWEHMTGETKKISEQTVKPPAQPPAEPALPATAEPTTQSNKSSAQPPAQPPSVQPLGNQTGAKAPAKPPIQPPAKGDNSWVYALAAVLAVAALLGYKYKKSRGELPPKKRKALVKNLEKKVAEAEMVYIGPARKKRKR